MRALLAKATPGPWVKPFEDGAICTAEAPNISLLALDKDDMAIVDKPVDAALIVAAVNALPALLDVAEAARECLGRSYIMVVDRERLAAALAKLETP